MVDRFENLHEDLAQPVGLTSTRTLRMGKGRRAASTGTGPRRGALLEPLDPIGARSGEPAPSRRSRIVAIRKNQISSILDASAARGRAGGSSESSLCDERSGRAGRGAG